MSITPDSTFDPSDFGGPERLESLCRLADMAEVQEPPADLPVDYRGPEPLAVARSLGDWLTPEVIAAARRTGVHDPQTVKRVWHLLARFGRSW